MDKLPLNLSINLTLLFNGDIEQVLVESYKYDKREKELWREAYRFGGKIKRFLNLRTFIPVPEPFHAPIYGYEP